MRIGGTMWLGLWLAACRADHAVVWDAVGSADVPADVAVALLTLGQVEGDRPLVDGLHASGSSLVMDVRARDGSRTDTWRVESMRAETCQVVSVPPATTGVLRVELLFGAAGATDLFVVDAAGEVQDVQAIEVRDPADAALVAYEEVATGTEAPLDAVNVLAGARVTVAVSWAAADGEGLSGTGILDVATDLSSVEVTPTDGLAGFGLDAFDVEAAGVASAGTLTLLAGSAPVREVPLRVVAPAEVDDLQLQLRTIHEEPADGTVRAEVLAGDAAVLGAEVSWTEDGRDLGTGAWVGWEGADGTADVTACYLDLCRTTTIPGHVTSLGAAAVPEPPIACGCRTVQGGSGLWALGALLVARRRRA